LDNKVYEALLYFSIPKAVSASWMVLNEW